MQKLFAPLRLSVFIFPFFGQSNYAGLTGSATDAQHLLRGRQKSGPPQKAIPTKPGANG